MGPKIPKRQVMRATGPSGTNRLAGKTFSERARPGNLFGCPGNRFDHLVIVQVFWNTAKALASPRCGLGPARGGQAFPLKTRPHFFFFSVGDIIKESKLRVWLERPCFAEPFDFCFERSPKRESAGQPERRSIGPLSHSMQALEKRAAGLNNAAKKTWAWCVHPVRKITFSAKDRGRG